MFVNVKKHSCNYNHNKIVFNKKKVKLTLLEEKGQWNSCLACVNCGALVTRKSRLFVHTSLSKRTTKYGIQYQSTKVRMGGTQREREREKGVSS